MYKYVVSGIVLSLFLQQSFAQSCVYSTVSICLDDTIIDEIIVIAPAYNFGPLSSYDYTNYNVDSSAYDVNSTSAVINLSPEAIDIINGALEKVEEDCQHPELVLAQCALSAKETYNNSIEGCGSFNFTDHNGAEDLLIFQFLDVGTFYQICQEELKSTRDVELQRCEVDYQARLANCDQISKELN